VKKLLTRLVCAFDGHAYLHGSIHCWRCGGGERIPEQITRG
jgi:hypothetical protein